MTGYSLTVLREAIQAADAYDCGCDDPGNESRCINTERFAALDDVEALIEAARTLAHEHPGVNWGYDGEGVHAYEDGEPVEGCPLCAALARFPATSPTKEQA